LITQIVSGLKDELSSQLINNRNSRTKGQLEISICNCSNKPTLEGETPVYCLVRRFGSISDQSQTHQITFEKLLQRFVAAGADINIQGPHLKQTPLMLVSAARNLHAVKCLLKYKPKLSLVDESGSSAVHYILGMIPAAFGEADVYLPKLRPLLKTILDQQGSVEFGIQNKAGYTPLTYLLRLAATDLSLEDQSFRWQQLKVRYDWNV